MDYPPLLLKFTLLIQAGMTARRAFQKMAADYMRTKPAKGRFAYEAIVTACHEMDSGVSELEAYRLEKEALEAWDERKRKARVLGEAAATKLLVPMVMMLVVVMAIIMIPAFLSFYGQ